MFLPMNLFVCTVFTILVLGMSSSSFSNEAKLMKKSRAPLSQSKAPTVKVPKKGSASVSPTVTPSLTVSPTTAGGLTITPTLIILPAGTPSTASLGLPGPAGPPGLTGPAGPIGLTGLAGEIGATGATGLKGLTGPNGIAGIQGIRGVDGTHVITQAPCSVVCDAVICAESAITCIDNISATSFEPLPPLCSQEDVVCSSVNCHCA